MPGSSSRDPLDRDDVTKGPVRIFIQGRRLKCLYPLRGYWYIVYMIPWHGIGQQTFHDIYISADPLLYPYMHHEARKAERSVVWRTTLSYLYIYSQVKHIMSWKFTCEKLSDYDAGVPYLWLILQIICNLLFFISILPIFYIIVSQHLSNREITLTDIIKIYSMNPMEVHTLTASTN